jgi:hypothetical protein
MYQKSFSMYSLPIKKVSMKKILTFLMMVISVQLLAQNPNIFITGITVTIPAFPDPNTANWGTGTSVFTIQASTSERTLKEAMSSTILVIIKKGESKVCGTYTNQNAPASSFNKITMIWTGRNAVSLLGQECNLSPGDYKFCVQFFLKGQKISEEVCKTFTIKTPETIRYQPPQAISPADGAVINEADAKKPLTFRWTPVTPKPREPVLYKLRIFEIRQGQTATTAIKSAGPLLEKEVSNQTQYVLPSLSQLPVAKGSSYGWYVQAVDSKGNPVGANNGMSNIMTFRVTSFDCNFDFSIRATDSICIGMTNNLNKYHICFKSMYSSTNVNLTYSNTGSGIKAYMPTSPFTQYSISNVTTLVTQLMNVGLTVQNYCFDVLVPPGTTTLRINLQGDDKDPDPNNTCQPGATYDIKLPPCLCTACDSVQINIPDRGTITMDSTLWLQTPVNVNPGGIKSIKTQLVYFEYKPETDECVSCNRKSGKWGNFLGATLSDNEFPLNGLLTHGHEHQWITANANGATLNGNFNFHISLPPLVTCCKVEIKFCIRYIFEFVDCTVCEKVVCYSYSKTSK